MSTKKVSTKNSKQPSKKTSKNSPKGKAKTPSKQVVQQQQSQSGQQQTPQQQTVQSNLITPKNGFPTIPSPKTPTNLVDIGSLVKLDQFFRAKSIQDKEECARFPKIIDDKLNIISQKFEFEVEQLKKNSADQVLSKLNSAAAEHKKELDKVTNECKIQKDNSKKELDKCKDDSKKEIEKLKAEYEAKLKQQTTPPKPQSPSPPPPPPPPPQPPKPLPPGIPSHYKECATEGGSCTVEGNTVVYYGANGKFVNKVLSGNVPCTNGVFGDPIYGVTKVCYAPLKLPAPYDPGNGDCAHDDLMKINREALENSTTFGARCMKLCKDKGNDCGGMSLSADVCYLKRSSCRANPERFSRGKNGFLFYEKADTQF